MGRLLMLAIVAGAAVVAVQAAPDIRRYLKIRAM
jgi:hypothetical protein